jgi:hypothetical protein
MRPTALHTAANDAIRRAARAGLRAIGVRMRREMRRAVDRYEADQRALRGKYGVTDATPIRPYDDDVRRAVEAAGARHPGTRFAYTSGSTSKPKKIAFPPERLRAIKRGSLSVISRLLLERDVAQASLFILSGLQEDDSLSSLLLDGKRDRSIYAVGLVMPGRHLSEPPMREAIARYGATAARLFLLVLSNPGVLYSTNPSTLALFLTDVHESWDAARSMLRALIDAPDRLGPDVLRVARQVASRGWEARARVVAEASAPPPFAAYVPGVALYCCWDGGYVRSFLDRIQAFLPRERFTHVPMYSMSTETMETLTWFDRDAVRFLPIAPGVLYEFLPEGAEDDPRALVPAYEVEPGRTYAMVVSDDYGLTRYQTEDLFRCEARVGAAPDLRFVRRRGLTYSFTGEKLTDAHVAEAFEAVRSELPALRAAGVQLTCVPSRPEGTLVPLYRVVLAPPGAMPEVDPAEVAARFDARLSAINTEYGGKRATRRLGAPVATVIPYDRLAAQLDPKTAAGSEANRGWDTQFKLLPLLTRLWEEHGLGE